MTTLIRAGILFVPVIDDTAGAAVRLLLRHAVPGAAIVVESQVADQRNWIADILRRWSDEEELDLILTVGGTLPAPGPSPTESVPDATGEIVERSMPGLAEGMRGYAQEQSSLALIDRGIVGIRGRTLIVNLPCGAGPAQLFLEGIVDVIEPVMAHLGDTPSAPQLADIITVMEDYTDLPGRTEEITPQRASLGLDPAEFADFLRRGQQPPT